jgi:peroxin-12
MLMQVGGEGTRPTFFEMSATEHLPTSLRAALLYFLGVRCSLLPSFFWNSLVEHC